MFTVTIAIFGVLANGIAITVSISNAWASVPISFGIGVLILSSAYQFKHYSMMTDDSKEKEGLIFGICEIISVYNQHVDELLYPTRVPQIRSRKNSNFIKQKHCGVKMFYF